MLRPLLGARIGVFACAAVCGALAMTACTSSSTPSPSSGSARAASSGGSSPAPSSTAPKAVATTRVPAATPGNLTSTVPSRAIRTAAPVALTATAQFNRQVSARLTKVDRVTATGRAPGEISGKALSLTVSFTNSASSAIDTGDVVVNVVDKSARPLVLLETASTRVRASIAGGATATGVYVFNLPAGFTAPVTVSVSYSTAAPVVLFVGNA